MSIFIKTTLVIKDVLTNEYWRGSRYDRQLSADLSEAYEFETTTNVLEFIKEQCNNFTVERSFTILTINSIEVLHDDDDDFNTN